MQSIQLIKNRIQSISSTRQITQSMRLMASTKVQKTRSRMAENRPFLEHAQQLVRLAIAEVEGPGGPYLEKREGLPAAVIVITGDRGLCGGYNANAVRKASALVRELGDVRIVTVGIKARDHFRRRKTVKIAESYFGMSETPDFMDAKTLADLTLGWYQAGEVGEIYVVYTNFVNMLMQEAAYQRLLPLERNQEIRQVSCEPGGAALLDRTVPFYIAASVYGAMLESAVCEQSARISSMDSATKASDEMVEKLSLSYNKARQAAITQELIEIVGGASAV